VPDEPISELAACPGAQRSVQTQLDYRDLLAFTQRPIELGELDDTGGEDVLAGPGSTGGCASRGGGATPLPTTGDFGR
jgi:hypothetical protein